jgi:hypothetical protein
MTIKPILPDIDVSVVDAGEDDLEVVLAGKPVELPYPVAHPSDRAPAGKPITVRWEPHPRAPLDVAAVRSLRGDGARQFLTAVEGGKRFTATVRIATGQARRDPEQPGSVQVTLSSEAYRMLCGVVQSECRTDRDDIHGHGWAELRRSFPAADYVREPSCRAEIRGIAAASTREAERVARETIADALRGHSDHDLVILAPVLEDAGRYSVTVVYHHPELSERGTRVLPS